MSVQIVQFRTDPQRVGEVENAPHPLSEIPESGAFRDRIGQWAGGPVPHSTPHLIGRYTG